MKTVTVYIDQPVWERQRVEVDVPDELEGEELKEYLHDAINDLEYRACGIEILDVCFGGDTYHSIVRPDGSREEF